MHTQERAVHSAYVLRDARFLELDDAANRRTGRFLVPPVMAPVTEGLPICGSSLKGVGKSEFGGGLAIAEGGSRLA